MTWEGGQSLPVDLPFLIILNAAIDTSAIILVDSVAEGADNFHISLSDTVCGELGIFKRLVNC